MKKEKWIEKGRPLNVIINCDCMDIMKDMSDNYINLAIVDPPYGINVENFNLRTNCHKNLKSSWKDIKPDKKYFDELIRISENQIIWGGNYFTNFLKPNNNWIIWYKNNAGVSFSMAELAWSSIRKNIQLFNFRPMGKLNKIHPTQKPVALYRWLLQNYAKPGDLIFDSHSGSGSLAIACIEEGFNYIACELDSDYHKASIERIKTYILGNPKPLIKGTFCRDERKYKIYQDFLKNY